MAHKNRVGLTLRQLITINFCFQWRSTTVSRLNSRLNNIRHKFKRNFHYNTKKFTNPWESHCWRSRPETFLLYYIQINGKTKISQKTIFIFKFFLNMRFFQTNGLLFISFHYHFIVILNRDANGILGPLSVLPNP